MLTTKQQLYIHKRFIVRSSRNNTDPNFDQNSHKISSHLQSSPKWPVVRNITIYYCRFITTAEMCRKVLKSTSLTASSHSNTSFLFSNDANCLWNIDIFSARVHTENQSAYLHRDDFCFCFHYLTAIYGQNNTLLHFKFILYFHLHCRQAHYTLLESLDKKDINGQT